MEAIIRALTWEFYRENRWWWICLAAAVLAIGALALVFDEPAAPAELPPLIFFLILFAEAKLSLFFLFMKQYNNQVQRLGFPLHLYTKPVPTAPLVAWRLGLSILAVMALHGIITLTFRVSGNVMSPWLKPALLLALVVAWGQALVWLFPRIQRMQTLCGALALLPLITLLGIWVKSFSEETLSTLLRQVTFAPLLIGLGAAYALAWLAVSLERRNVSVNAMILLNRGQGTCRAHCGPLPARTAFWTLFHCEMQRKGWQWPLANAVGVLTLLLLWLLGIMPLRVGGAFLVFGGVINIFAFPVLIGFVFGQQGKTQQMLMESYKAAKPVTNQQFLRVWLLTSLTSLVLSWIVFLAAPILLWVLMFLFRQTEVWDEMARFGLPGYPRNLISIMGMLVAAWTLLALSATVMLAGRAWLAVTVWLGIWLIPAALGLFVEGLPASAAEIAASIIWLTLIAGLFGGTLTAFGTAIYRKLINLWTVLGCVIVYGAMVFLFARSAEPQTDVLFLCLMSAILTLPVLPVAAAPLALAWNRHR